MFPYRDKYFQRKENEGKVLSRHLIHKDQNIYPSTVAPVFT